MNKNIVATIYGMLFDDYGRAENTVSASNCGFTMEAVLLDLPGLIILGKQKSSLVMVKIQEQERTTVGFLEFESILTVMGLQQIMQPGKIGWNRVIQECWSLCMSTESEAVTCSFVGQYGKKNKVAILPKGQFFRFYMEVLTVYAEELSFDQAST